MKYLQKSFSLSMHVPGPSRLKKEFGKDFDWIDRAVHKERAEKPHEYVNNGMMCQVCGLGDQAKIHETKNAR